MAEHSRLVISVDSRQVGQADRALNALGQTSAVVSRLMAGLAASIVAREVYQAAEAYTTLTNRLKLVTSGSSELVAAQQAVFNIAQQSRQPLTATAELYQRIATNQKELGLSGQQMAGIVGTINKTLAISGTSAQSANAALIQLGQAFASGVLRGEELNSVMEQAPALAQAIARGMDITVGQLRKFGAEGKLTADAVIKALQDQSAAVDDLFGKMAPTVNGALTTVGNSFTQLVGKLDAASGTTKAMATGIMSISGAMDGLTENSGALEKTINAVGAALSGAAAAGAVLAMNKYGQLAYASYAARAQNIALAQSVYETAKANQIAAQSAVILAQREAQAAAGTPAQTITRIALAEAKMAERVATDQLAAANTRLTAASAGILSVLGGPMGIALAVGTVAAGYFLMRDGANSATDALIDQNTTIEDSVKKYKELGDAQQRFQRAKWIEKQSEAIDSATDALNQYARDGNSALMSLGAAGVKSAEEFGRMVAEVREGKRDLDSVTSWLVDGNRLLPVYQSNIQELAAEYEQQNKKAANYAQILEDVSSKEKINTAIKRELAKSQNDASPAKTSADWQKYIKSLTQTRDLVGANTEAQTAYNAAKMGATAEQIEEAKLIGQQTDLLKKYQTAVKDGDKIEQAALKSQITALFLKEETLKAAEEEHRKQLEETARKAEESAARQATALQRVADKYLSLIKAPNLVCRRTCPATAC